MVKLKRSNLWWLVLGSAFITSFTFAMPLLTGIRSSAQWPIGFSVLLTIAWLVVAREGVRVPALIANVFGIAVGILISKLYVATRVTKPLGSSFWTSSAIMIGALAAFFIWSIRKERQALESVEQFEEDFSSIEALPPDEKLKALDAKTQELIAEFEAIDRRTRRLQPLVLSLVGAGTIVLGFSLVEEFRRGPRLVSTIIDITGLILCLGYLGWAIYTSVTERRNKNEPSPPDSEG